MKLVFANGSPKTKNSASENVLVMLKKQFTDKDTIVEVNFRTPSLNEENMEQIAECNVIVLAFPLYVDGIPSHMLNCLYQMETYLKANPKNDILVYAIVNCGFYEGKQSSLALEMVKNWCKKAGIKWGQGLGIGGGGMLPMISNIPEGKGPAKNLWRALKTLANNISTNSGGENIFISPNFPRFLYKLSAEAGWRQLIKSNRLSRRDLSLKK